MAENAAFHATGFPAIMAACSAHQRQPDGQRTIGARHQAEARLPTGRGGRRRADLVDRLWPRGLKKSDAAIDRWLKDIAPSTALRKWFAHDPARWPEFRRRYAAEIRRHPDQLAELHAIARKGPVTLIFSARDELRNDAVVLRNVLLGR